MLFSNRKLAGGAESTIRAYISKECSLPKSSIFLGGVEQLEIWLKRFPKVAEIAALDPVDSPLIVSCDDLSSIIHKLASLKSKEHVVTTDDPPTPRMAYKDKNRINNMSNEYAATLRKRYLKETAQIQKFLSEPENIHILQLYKDVVDEFELKIIASRKDYQSFDKVMNYILDLLFSRDPVLKANKRLTRIMLFYMYWNCDIGSEEDA